ncbi:MAG TPA: 2Fe-2S iron-sulfur cluster-binding protein [Polyangiaceae bacterium]
MAKVRFLDQNIEVEVEIGSSLLEAAQKSGAPEGSACGGVCACSTCHVYVESGAELLSEAEEDEEDILDKAFDVQMSSRLGCQATIQREGIVSVRISKESLDTYYNEHPEARR